MAKAKKPTSGAKTPTAAPDNVTAEDKTASAEKAETSTSSASKAASAKTAKKASAKAGSAASKSTTQATTSKTVESKDVSSKPDATDKKDASGTASETKPDALSNSDKKPDPVKTEGQDKNPDPKTADTKAEVKTAVSKPAPVAPPPQQQRSVFWPLVFGGVIAGVLGFLASEMNVFNTRVDTTQIKETLAGQEAEIEALKSVEPAAPVDLGGIEGTLASINTSLDAFEARLAELENRPVVAGDGTGPSPEYAQELAALQSSVETQKSEIERLLQNALSVEEATANAARAAGIQAAVAKITAAMSSGAGFSEAMDDLAATGIEDIPAALTDTAADGVPTLLALQTEFPDTARAALASARAAGTDAGEGGVAGFLRRQLGARSVAPKEGSDPDAVLSRAEAAVRNGDVAGALAEIDALPAESQDAMADWLAAARTRADAQAAVQDLSQRLTAN